MDLRKATIGQLYYLARYTEYHLNAISELARRELSTRFELTSKTDESGDSNR